MKTTQEQIDLVRAIMKNMEEHILSKASHFPPSWDGFELREYIADKFDSERVMDRKRHRRRMLDYKNDVMTRPL